MRSPAWTWDELLLACALVAENDWRELREGDHQVQALSVMLRSLTIHGDEVRALPEFRSPGSVSRKTTDIATNHPAYAGARTKGGRLDKQMIQDFIRLPDDMQAAAATLRESYTTGELRRVPEQFGEVDDDGLSALEGRLLTRLRLARERDPKLRRAKIRQAQKAGAPLRCEVCAFDFGSFYGPLGEGYIEVHHVVPLHVSGLRTTALEDLALLCSNCHRMCHRNRSGESWRTPAALRTVIGEVVSHG